MGFNSGFKGLIPQFLPLYGELHATDIVTELIQ